MKKHPKKPTKAYSGLPSEGKHGPRDPQMEPDVRPVIIELPRSRHARKTQKLPLALPELTRYTMPANRKKGRFGLP